MKTFALSLAVLLVMVSATSVDAVTAGATRDEVLIVVNQQSPASLRIGEYYRQARGIPKSNVCSISCSTTETITVTTYLQQIAQPIKDFLTSHQLKDKIKFLVTTKGIPLKMYEQERLGSIDSSLTLLFNDSGFGRAPVGEASYPFSGAVANPFFGSNDTFSRFATLPKGNSNAEAFPQLRDLAQLSNGTVIAVGNKGVIVRGSPGNWNVVEDLHKGYIQSNFTSVSFVDANQGWAATDDGKIYKTTNGGQDWTRSRYVANDRLNDMAMASASEGWAVGETVVSSTERRPLVLHYSNSQWTSEITGLTSGSLFSITAPDINHVWACGPGGVILRRTSGVWSTAGNGAPNATYRSISMVFSGGLYQGWAVGDGGVVIHTINGGDTWSQQSSGATGRLSHACALDADNVWVTPDWQQAGLLRSSNAGGNWNNLTADHNGKLAVAFSDALNGYAVGADGTTGRFAILQTTNGGDTWSPSYTGQDTVWKLNYLVCRLDGYSLDADKDGLPDDVKAIIDRAVAQETTGSFVLDISTYHDTVSGYKIGNDQTRDAKAALVSAGRAVICDEDLGSALTYMTGAWLQQRFGHAVPVAGYCSWGSNDGTSLWSTEWARCGFIWKPGAVAMTYVSTDGRTFDQPDFLLPSSNSIFFDTTWSDPNQVHAYGAYQGWRWVLHNTATGQTYSATSINAEANISFSGLITSGYLEVNYPDPDSPGSFIPLPGARLDASVSAPISGGKAYKLRMPQSLAADMLHDGCSGVIGNVFEPYLDACGCPDKAFVKYASGYTWAESAYAGLRYLSWQEVVIGDPLMAPYAPIVKITSPKKGAAVSGSIAVTATATDPGGVNRAELFVDGVSAGVLTTSPYQWTVNTTQGGITDGKHEIEVAAYRDGPSGVTFRGYDYAQVLVSNSRPIKSPNQAVSMPDGSPVTLVNGVATVDSDVLPSGMYVEYPLRTSAIRVVPTAGDQLYEGCAISARGVMSTFDGERELLADDVTLGQWVMPLKPVGIAGLRIGGWSPLLAIPTLPGSSGVYNVGTLVRLFGKVITGGGDYFYLDDASGLLDNSGHPGVKVKCGSLIKPTAGLVAVVGIAGAETINGALARVIRVRRQEDIVPIQVSPTPP